MKNASNESSANKGPFSGINVIDMGVGGVDPLAATMLGFLGANVVKVEAPFREMLYSQLPQQKGVGFAWLNSNLNKRNVILDLREANDLARFQALVQEADIVMENQKPGSLAKFGVTIEELKKLNPNIILMSCPGWGNFGPMRAWPCFAPYAEAHGSAGGLNGPEGDRPELIRYPYHDANASSYINASVLLALMARARTGQAQEIHLSQLGTSMAVTISRSAEYLVTGQDPVPLGSASASTAPHQAFLCQDNRWLALGVERQTQWLSLCEAIGIGDLLNDPRFVTNVERVANRKALAEILAQLFASKPSRWWQIRLDKAKVPNSLFIHPDDAPSHLQYTENDLFTYLDFPKQGPSMVSTFPWRFDKIDPSITHAPLPGDHTEEVVAGGFGNKPFEATPSAHNLLDAGDPPLKGYKVVELSQGLSGPYTSLLLADAGAEVTKIEPPEGDHSREFAPRHNSGVGAAFMILNRNKKLLKLNLTSAVGKAELAKMLSETDILIYDWTPTIEKDLGIDGATLEKLNPRLISCAISPFGKNGPMSGQPGSELTVQAASGITSFHGRIGEPPVRVGVDMANISTSVYAFQAILVSLFHRLYSEEGQHIHMSQLGVLNFMLTYHYSAVFDPDEWIGAYCEAFTNPPNWGYYTENGYVYPGLQWTTEEQFTEMCRDLGMGEILKEDIRFQNMSQQPGGIRRAFRSDLRGVWEKYFKSKTVSELVEIVVNKGGLVPVVNTVRQALEDTQCQMQGMHVPADTPWGKVTFYYPPYHGSWTNPEPQPPVV